MVLVRRTLVVAWLLVAACSTAGTGGTTPTTVLTTTSTTSSPTPVRVAVLGDFGNGGRAERDVSEQVKAVAEDKGIDALVTVGDNLYSDDVQVNWTEPYGWVADAEIPVLATIGNHDLDSVTRTEAELDLWAIPGRWYSAPLGRYTLIVLDANQPSDPEQLAWLDGALSGPGPFVVAFHQPAFSCGKYEGVATIRETWVPRLAAAHVALVLNGHDHNYQRFEVGGVVYVVTGGGGAELYGIGTCPTGTPAPIVSDDAHHQFLLLELGARIHGTVFASDGSILDSFIIG
jgi:acid phosphatase